MYKVFGEFAFFFLNKSAKNAQLFYFIATKMTIFNTHIKIEACAEERSPVDKKTQRGEKIGTRHIFIVYL